MRMLNEIMTKFICYCKKYCDEFDVEPSNAFMVRAKSVYYFIDAWWKDRSVKLTCKYICDTLRDLICNEDANAIDGLLSYNEDGEILCELLRYMECYFKGSYDGKKVSDEFLSSLRSDLIKAQHHKEEIIAKTQEIYFITNNMSIPSGTFNNISMMLERQAIEGSDNIFLKSLQFFNYGYLVGKRDERARRKKSLSITNV